MDILDTSAIRSISKDKIKALASVRPLAVSPISVWELLCHLDETVENEDANKTYRRRQGQLAKIAGLRVLDDPFAQHAITVGAQAVTNPTRFEDAEGAAKLVKMAVSAPTLEAFYAQTCRFREGKQGSLRGLAANARRVLAEEEKKFSDQLRKMWQRVDQRSCATRAEKLSDEEFWKWMQVMLTDLHNSYQQDGISEAQLMEKVVRSKYLYYGYVFARMCKYVSDQGSDFSPALNDAEDGFICMHLDLLGDDILVTGDSGTIGALSRVFDICEKYGSPEIKPSCRVMTAIDYVEAFLVAPG
jgi:hypothetical protein